MWRHVPTIITAVVFCGLFVLALWFMVTTWQQSTATMSIHGWIALGLGVFFSFVVGCGLMALVFYSSRKGYDEAARTQDTRELP
jgi:uncharacterized membrane protein